MKRVLLITTIICILLTGCGEKKESDTPSTTKSTTTKKTTTSSDTTKSTKSTIKPTRDMTTLVGSKDHIYTSVKTGKKNKYSYVYKDQDACRKRADADAYASVFESHPYVAIDCEEVKDSNGKKFFGAFFYKEADDSSIFYY